MAVLTSETITNPSVVGTVFLDKATKPCVDGIFSIPQFEEKMAEDSRIFMVKTTVSYRFPVNPVTCESHLFVENQTVMRAIFNGQFLKLLVFHLSNTYQAKLY